MRHARTIAMATTLLADGRTGDVADMVEPLLDPVSAPAARTGQILLRGLMARVEVLRRGRPERALELLPTLDEVSSLCTCVRAEASLWRGWARVRRPTTLDETTRGLRQLKEGHDLYRSIHDPVSRTWALLGQARAYAALNEYGLMRRILDDTAPLTDRLQDTQAQRWLHDLRVETLRTEGDFERAHDHLTALRDIGANWNAPRLQGRDAAHAALLRLYQEASPAVILEEADTALSHLRRLSDIPPRPFLWAVRARVGALCRQDETADALALLDDAEATLINVPTVEASLQMLRARVALRRGNAEHARSLLDAAFDRSPPSLPDLSQSEVALLYGRVFAHQDRYEEAQRWLHTAERTARESGHRLHQKRAEDRVQTLESRSDAPSASSFPQSTDPTAAVEGFVAESRAMQSVADTIRRIRPSRSPVLITGEGGSGKRLVAQALHETSVRAQGPLESVSCAPTQPEEPLRNQLFGASSNDGARGLGAVQAAQGGTLVLEDIDALPQSLQSSLLRLLNTGAVPAPDGDSEEPVDVRVVATTTADLDARVAEDRFLGTLRDRLRTITLHVPPLRERRADIPLLARHFLDRLHPDDSALVSITQPAMEALLRYNWPGNVRQLHNEIERALVHVQSEPAPTITLDMLLDTIVDTARQHTTAHTSREASDAILEPDQTLNDVLSRTEKAVIERVLRACDGQVTASADVLGLSRQGLYKKMKRLDIDASAFQSASEPAPAS